MVPLTFAEHDSDIKKACTQNPQSFVTRFWACNLLRYQVSVYRTIGPLVLEETATGYRSSPGYISSLFKCMPAQLRQQ